MKGTLIGIIALIYFITFLDIARFYPIGQSVGRNGKQCDDAFDGAYPDGDCSRVFC